MLHLVNDWGLMNFFIYVGVLLFIAKIIKEKVPFLNKIIIPTALIAGFIGLLLSDGFLNVIEISEPVYQVYEGVLADAENEYDNVVVIEVEEAEDLGINIDLDDYEQDEEIILVKTDRIKRTPIIFQTVYHALAIGFIALTLRRDKNETNKKVWSTGMVIVITYLIQALIGTTVVILLFKEVFLGAGLLLPLGFGQGPGLATSIGIDYMNGEFSQLAHGGALGATIASVGFLVGGIIGVIALNFLARKHNLVASKTHSENSKVKKTFEFETITELRVFDAVTVQVVIIFVIYAFVYLTLVALENYILPSLGGLGETFAGVFHGFNFLIGIIYALIFKKILTSLEQKGKNINFMTNNYVLSNISSIAFNFMIVTAVLTITIESIKMYYLLVIVLSLLGTVITYGFIMWITKKVYKGKYQVHYFLGFFGMLTGTASTGLALLKGVDQDFESPVAEEMVVGSGTAISMALPLFALLMFPGLALKTGNDLYTALVFIVPFVYAAILLGVLLYINRDKNK